MPEMQYVDSSNIEAIGYDPDNQELHVRFLKSGETYVYYSVEEWVFQEFLQSVLNLVRFSCRFLLLDKKQATEDQKREEGE